MKGGNAMRLVVHQALKDLHLLKWILAAWVLLNVAMHLLVLIGVGLPPQTPAATLAANIYSVLRALLVAGFIAIPVIAIQNDPGAGTTAFWFTRPISVRLLLGAKFLLVVPAVVLFPVLVDVIALLVARVPLRSTVAPELDNLAIGIAWLLPVVAIAAFTAGLAQFVLGAILEVFAFIAIVALAPWALALPRTRLFTDQTAPVFFAALIAAGFLVVVFAYLSRNLRRSACAAGVMPVCLGVLLLFWPSDATRPLGPTLSSPVVVSPGAEWHAAPYGSSSTDGGCELSGGLEVSAIPPTQTVETTVSEMAVQSGNRRVEARGYSRKITTGNPRKAADERVGPLPTAANVPSRCCRSGDRVQQRALRGVVSRLQRHVRLARLDTSVP